MSLKRKATDLAADAAKKPKANSAITSFFSQPKPNPPTSSTNPAVTHTNGDAAPGAEATQPVKFDKDAWVAKLTPEQKELLKLEIETLHESWLGALKEEVVSKEFLDLKRFLKRELETGKKVFPPSDDIYSWSRHTPLHNVKAVIVGQDPYHNLNQAHGLCFSVRPPTPAPPSLKNMYTALKKDYPDFKAPPKNGGLLTPWADRGVLMLNACLTVRAHEANSHSNKGWEGFTQKVIDLVAKKRTRGVVFLAWGNPAQKRCTRINGQKHLVLKSVHPSPLSASRGFFDCGHFKKANEWLKQRYGEEGMIDWNLDVSPEDADSETYVVTDVGSTDFRATQTYCPNATVSTSTVYGVNQTITTALPASTITIFQAPTSLAPVETPSAPASTPVVVASSGFEDGTGSDYNTSNSDPRATAAIVQDGPFQPNSGSSYLLITFEESDPSKVRRQTTNQLSYNVTQAFAATAGNFYTLTAYAAKSQSDDVEPQCSLTICAEDSCGNAQPLSTTYSQISYLYTASATNANAIATFIVQCSRAAYVALDDISISSTSAIPSSAQNGVSTVFVTRTLTIQQSQSARELQTTTLQVTTVLDGSTVVYTTMVSQESYEPAPVQTTTLVTTVLSGSILTLTTTVSTILYQTPTLQSGVPAQTVSFVATRTTVIPSIVTATETTSLTDVYTKTVSEVSTTTTTVTRALDQQNSLNKTFAPAYSDHDFVIYHNANRFHASCLNLLFSPTAIDNYNNNIPTAANVSTETLHTTEILTAQPQTFTLQGQNLTRTVTFTAPPETYTETLPAETRTLTLPPDTTSILGPTVTATFIPSSSAASSSVRPWISGGVSLALASPTAIIGDLSGSSVDYDDVVSSEIELPFQVWLYSQSSANVRVSTNGVVGFTTLNNEFDNIDLPYFGFSNCSDIPQEDGSESDNCFTDTAALALWADLYIYNGTQQGIYYEITGTAPNRQVTFEFYESLYSDPTQSYHFLVHFLEASPNYVTFQYLNVSDWGCTATVGVESLSGGSRYSQYSYLQGVIYPGLQITFNTNSGSNVYTVDAPGNSSGPAPACPSALGTI
ncbi:uracil-DNA glycosylase [Hortaea werneckii]|nr:uracil-DNA glycosylase [Hortaea werneckii]